MIVLSFMRRFRALVLLAPLVAGCTDAETTSARGGGSPASTASGEIITVGLQPWPAVVSVQGNLQGDEQAVIGAKVAGRVETVLVDLGSPVQQGDPLCVLEMETFGLAIRHAEAQVESIRAKLGLEPGQDEANLDHENAPPVRQERAMVDDARAMLERSRAMSARQVLPIEQLQNLEAAFFVAQARYDSALNLVDEQLALLAVTKEQLAQARQAQEDATIRAPFDGVVQHRFAAPGVYLQPGSAVASLVRVDPLRFRAGVPEREALKVRIGQTIQLEVLGVEEPVIATITRLAPALDLNSRSLTIEADIPNPDGTLRPGLFAEGEIVVDPDSEILAVPVSAVSTFAGVEKVWKVVDGKATETPIVVGRRQGDLLEILAGLELGDEILAEAKR